MKLPTPNGPMRRSGFSLIEMLFYLAVITLVLGAASVAFYRCWDAQKQLRRNAEDIVRALHAGEQWRADLRAATGPIQVTDQDGAEQVVIPARPGPVTYAYARGELHRQARPAGPTTLVLDRVKASRMQADPRPPVAAWRWELELQPAQKQVRLPPLFTFETVAPHQTAP